jgi:hypothetical protein
MQRSLYLQSLEGAHHATISSLRLPPPSQNRPQPFDSMLSQKRDPTGRNIR